MRIDRDKSEVRITDGMSLEQAMHEVRRYLEAARQRNDSTHAESQSGSRDDKGVSTIDDYIARLIDLAGRFDYREDSSVGFWRNLAKKSLARLLRRHIQQSEQYAWTTIETLRTIRQDLLRMQQQLSQLEERMAITKRQT
jgi:phage shock protein A